MPSDHEPSDREPSERLPLVIDCDQCTMAGTDACEDCVVTFVCDHDPAAALVIDVAEERAIRLLSDQGLVPRLRHRRRTG